MRIRIWTLLVVVSFVAVLDAVQRDRAAIAGVVTDETSAVFPGATCELSGPERRSAVTNERGEFQFTNLRPGTYELTCSLPGFTTAIERVTVGPGKTGRLAVRLRIATLAETVSVTSASRRVQTLSTPVRADWPGGRWRYRGPMNTESYDSFEDNPFHRVTTDPLSTFSIDVDTASYANTRRMLNDGELPPPGAVRIEEFINYFRFDYPQPEGTAPFSVSTELSECPWNPRHRLALIGLRGREIKPGSMPRRNLVFLIDVSGSMDEADKLPLVRNSLRMLVDILAPQDSVAIVVYAGSSGLVLPATPGDRQTEILTAIANLSAGGSTNGGEGIRLAYRLAREHFVEGGVNRVVLATDGDFNVGVTSEDELVRLIEQERASGVFLSVLGVGTGNYQDSMMEKLADKGNGNYSYLDSMQEARKVLVREANATLVTIAKDVKIQVEFNPKRVAAYRLIGYEDRVLNDEDFLDDSKDAGEIGAGHSVTALYEIVPAGEAADVPSIGPLRYQREAQLTGAASSDELMTVKLRFKPTRENRSRPIDAVMVDRVRSMGRNLGFASAIAEFGMLLRQSKYAGEGSFESAAARARRFLGKDADGDRAELVTLVERAASLRRSESTRR